MISHNSDQHDAAASQKNEIDLIQLVTDMFEHRVLIVCIMLVFTLCASIYAFSTKPIYQADAMIQVEAKQGNSLLNGLSQYSSNFSPDVSAELLMLKSRMILGVTVDKLGLTYTASQRTLPILGPLWERMRGRKPGEIEIGALQVPLLNGKPQTLLLTVLDDNRYYVEGESFATEGIVGKKLFMEGGALLVSSLRATPGTKFVIKTMSRLEAIRSIHNRLKVVESGKQSGMIMLTLTGDDMAKTSKVLNTITESYISQNIARQEEKDSRSLTFLEKQLPKIRTELNEAEARLNSFREQHDSVDLSLDTKLILDQIVNVENNLNELTFREAEVAQIFKKDHPTYRTLQAKKQRLEQERARLNNRISSMPSMQQEILRLSRDVDSGRMIHQQLLTRQQELNISRSSAIGNARVIDTAVTQPDPIAPRKALIIMFGNIIGFILSVCIVLIRSAFNRGITSLEPLEMKGIPLLATLPRSVWLRRQTHCWRSPFSRQWKHKTTNVPFLPYNRPTDMFVEAVRGLRTSLYFMMKDASNNIVMLSSPTANCGKTLISTSLAAIAAQAGQRVLFIDGDMRKGYAHNIFELNNRCGLSSVLEYGSTWQDAIQPYDKGGFDVITCGPQPLHPSELLMSEYFQSLISLISGNYDIVIVDTPPLLAVTDPSLIARMAATTLLIARYDVTSQKEILTCINSLKYININLSGVILNDIVKSPAFYNSDYSY